MKKTKKGFNFTMENNTNKEKNNISYERAIEYAKMKYGDRFDKPEFEIDVNVTIYDFMLGHMKGLEDKKQKK